MGLDHKRRLLLAWVMAALGLVPPGAAIAQPSQRPPLEASDDSESSVQIAAIVEHLASPRLTAYDKKLITEELNFLAAGAYDHDDIIREARAANDLNELFDRLGGVHPLRVAPLTYNPTLVHNTLADETADALVEEILSVDKYADRIPDAVVSRIESDPYARQAWITSITDTMTDTMTGAIVAGVGAFEFRLLDAIDEANSLVL